MEKRTPHCKLTVVKVLVEAGKVRTTHAARVGANELGFQAGTPDFSGKLAKPVLVRVVAKQLFYGTGTPLAEIPGLHSQNMRDKPCRIVSAAGNFACDLFRQNFRGFRLTTPTCWPSRSPASS